MRQSHSPRGLNPVTRALAFGYRSCFLTFFVKVWVHLPWLPSYSMISRISRALVSSASPDAFTSLKW